MKKIIFLFFLSKILIFAAAALAPRVIPVFGNKFPYTQILIETKLPYWIWSFGNFDGVHYLRIAQDGYVNQFAQAFFPLYPLLVRLISYLTFGNFLTAALILSNLAFFASLFLFYKLVKKISDEKIAIWSSAFLLAFPTSFYFQAVYTEGLFFLLIIASFYFFQQKKIILASFMGSLASATRLAGIFLAPSAALTKNKKNLIPIFTIPLGLLIYMMYLKIGFHNPFYFLTAQSIWGQERSTTEIVLLPQVFWRYIKILLTTNGLPLFNGILELTATIFAVIMLILSTKIVSREWLVFSWIAVITPTLTGTLASMPRYILIAFPIYIALAQIKSVPAKILLITSFMILQTMLVILFTRGYWIA